MTYYTDNRFDDCDQAQYRIEKPIGINGKQARLWFRCIALPAYPGWYHLDMHGDYCHSVDCSTCDVLGVIRELQDEWVADLTQRFGKKVA